ncbi:Hypothetical protein CpOVID04_0264 [Corynebacterium pseudotuberculosis]|nr:Hypothetical protein CpCAP1R_0262 [Corynebacterium pseudotuberculosis]QBI72219.1 Hypothetical protein Cp38MAT_0262 [Corynebacterium pseudotuberculosis]QBK59728.1 Hypothetical protein CpE7_0262 [Corynebacterium pseudotuberculosis]QCG71792.1 Hypothetical protein CpOVI1FL_0261 [Corynebacterium pseudotuberculosis]QDL40148.1 Hypothetical protein CpOVID04_0264 [Corynebacterium pseudotuberculosis]
MRYIALVFNFYPTPAHTYSVSTKMRTFINRESALLIVI